MYLSDAFLVKRLQKPAIPIITLPFFGLSRPTSFNSQRVDILLSSFYLYRRWNTRSGWCGCRILKAIYEKSHSFLIAPLFLMESFCFSDEEIGDSLEIMDEEGYAKVARGAYAFGLRLLNGAVYVCIAAKGRQILGDKKANLIIWISLSRAS